MTSISYRLESSTPPLKIYPLGFDKSLKYACLSIQDQRYVMATSPHCRPIALGTFSVQGPPHAVGDHMIFAGPRTGAHE